MKKMIAIVILGAALAAGFLGLAVPRQGYVSGVAIEMRSRQDVCAINRSALCLVHRGGVTMIEMGVLL